MDRLLVVARYRAISVARFETYASDRLSRAIHRPTAETCLIAARAFLESRTPEWWERKGRGTEFMGRMTGQRWWLTAFHNDPATEDAVYTALERVNRLNDWLKSAIIC